MGPGSVCSRTARGFRGLRRGGLRQRRVLARGRAAGHRVGAWGLRLVAGIGLLLGLMVVVVVVVVVLVGKGGMMLMLVLVVMMMRADDGSVAPKAHLEAPQRLQLPPRHEQPLGKLPCKQRGDLAAHQLALGEQPRVLQLKALDEGSPDDHGTPCGVSRGCEYRGARRQCRGAVRGG